MKMDIKLLPFNSSYLEYFCQATNIFGAKSEEATCKSNLHGKS